MTFFLLLILLFFIYYLLRPILRVWFAYRSAKRRAEQMFNGAGQQRPYGQQRANGASRESTWPRPKPKKIDPNVGEYVEFEEISTYSESTHTDGTTTVKYEVEDQITDVEWEEVK